MASKYWIKLYHEILDDPKMGRLTDRLFRRTMQVFLMAGDYDADGVLPPTEDMAWRLRMGIDELETDLADLASTGIVQKKDDRWLVTKFATRQAASTGTERWRQWKGRQQRENYYQTPDKRNANETLTETDKDIDKETEEEAISRISSLYEQEIGHLTPMIREQIIDWVENHPILWVEDAIKIAVERNKRRVDYVNGILKNWRIEGRGEKSSIEKELSRKGYVQH